MKTEHRKTIGDAVREGTRILSGADVPDAAYDARALMLHVTGLDRTAYAMRCGEELSQDAEERYEALLRRRADREPLQYITGEADFMGDTYFVTPDVLIPRFDSEAIVECALRYKDARQILDLCTGSGCLLLSVLKMLPDAQGTGVDISEGAVRVAKENAKRLGLSERAEILEGDLFAPVMGRTFDMILCNPPYIPEQVITGLDPEVRDHEPHLALSGGEDGYTFYRAIVPEALQYLNEGGVLVFEVGYDQGESVLSMMKEAGFSETGSNRDLSGICRAVCGRK